MRFRSSHAPLLALVTTCLGCGGDDESASIDAGLADSAVSLTDGGADSSQSPEAGDPGDSAVAVDEGTLPDEMVADARAQQPDSAPLPDEDGAAVVAASFPETLACGATATARVEMENTGRTTWTREGGYKLGAVDDDDPLHPDPREWLGEDASVGPGETVEFEIPLTGPGAAGSVTTDWRMVREGVRWFGETTTHMVLIECEAPAARVGRVRLGAGGTLTDDEGTFNALGTTLMWAAWAFKFDRPKLERTLRLVADNHFDYIRALGVVGDYERDDYWEGREIDWRWADYDDVIAGLTDLAYDRGLRVEWTLIGDGQLNIPNEVDRVALIDRFLAMSVGREQKIMHFEIANEAWQNGFEGAAGIDQLRDLTEYMADRTEILVAASAPAGHECADNQEIYQGSAADLATIHFDRTNDLVDGGWRPVRQPWEIQFCEGIPTASNNEPIGPGASVATENEPVRLVAAAINTYVSGLPLYVFHTGAGVRGDVELEDMPGLGAFGALRALVPGDLVAWSRRNAHWQDAPFIVYAEDEGGLLLPDTMWPDLASPRSGAVRAYGAVSGEQFFVAPIGILDHVTVEARGAMSFEVFEPITGDPLGQYDLDAGQRVELRGAEALVIRGTMR